ncbi:efflux RND transporter permease subunit [Pararhizobium mangrovi]|uniref:Efflux RND transporter permease subunit n=1 Tax=Pararhizobium mangrovi TaxID=2590452 RepID=A0A506U878_9HYPH|nr:efflux RND transporter permease subunit [Pararhizobium mangrovi]TPW29546.1 efflux RND transporter permease subunit [Pararhizobium mangrovi]
MNEDDRRYDTHEEAGDDTSSPAREDVPAEPARDVAPRDRRADEKSDRRPDDKSGRELGDEPAARDKPEDTGEPDSQSAKAAEHGHEALGAQIRKALHGGGLTALVVRRPILAFVFSTLIVVAGIAAYFGVSVRELPDVDRPVITVRTDYTGAAPETMDREVTETIEGAAARVSGVESMSSESSLGRSEVTIEFSSSTDLNVAAADVRDAISRVRNDLPDDVDEPRIIKADANGQAVMRLAMTSTKIPVDELTQLADDVVTDRLAAVPGVADVNVYGDTARVFRIDVDQNRLASRGLTVADLSKALSTAAFDVPAGTLTSNTQDLVVRANAQLQKPADFERLMIANNVRLGDVATVTLGPETGTTALRANGRNGVGLGIVRQASANTLEISKGVYKAVAELKPLLPKSVDLRITSDDSVFINGALHEVVRSLIIAVIAVVIIIYLFLLDWRATLIPSLSLPVALIGTIAAIYLAGFSINILTLLAIVLATGLVVDDAIVVLENIVRRRGQGLGPRAATVLGTQEVFFAVIATTATLVAVFVPLSFLPGQAGGLFREFGFTLAFSVILSAFVALTLCPMLASRMLTEHSHHHENLLTKLGSAAQRVYGRCLRWALRVPLVIVLVALVFSAIAGVLYGGLRQELTPNEDRAVALMRVNAPQGVSLDYTQSQIKRIEDRLQPLVKSGEIRNIFSITGFGNTTNSGFMVLTLAPWGERERSQNEIVKDINAAAAKVPSLRAFAIQPNSLGIRGAGNGLQFAVVGNDYAKLSKEANAIMQEMQKDPAFGQVRLDYETTQPQLSVSIDREKASDLGIDITGLGDALQAMVDERKVATVFVGGKSHDVDLVSSTTPINDPTDLENIFVKTGDGRMVPMSSIATLKENAIAPELSREDQLRSVGVTASLSPQLALGDALAKVRQIAAGKLSAGDNIMPLAEAKTLNENSSGVAKTFGFAMVIILLVLAAQFESFISAIIIMATVPVGLACAVYALILTGGSVNVYSQIGLVLLVGIMAKNGILIVEFANQLRDEGYSVPEAIERASNIRLRPVLMTMIATILGALPLVLAGGAGAEAREALGWVIVGGLGFASVLTLFLTPVAYLLLAGFSKPRASEEARLRRELDAAADLDTASASPAE